MNRIYRLLVVVLFLMFSFRAYPQEKLIKDIDFDAISDTVYFDQKASVIICQLSTQNFKPTQSGIIHNKDVMTGVKLGKNGFTFVNEFMRWGYSCHFRYNTKIKQIQLIGMDLYSLGNIVQDDSGQSSVNLLTGDYVCNWKYFDHLANDEEGELIFIPTIKRKMWFPHTGLMDFDDKIISDYQQRNAKLVAQREQIMREKRKR